MVRTRDPVCGMCIDWEEAHAFQVIEDAVVYFCCEGCLHLFRAVPERFLNGSDGRHEKPVHCGRDLPHPRISAHGLPVTVARDSVPRVGALTLDEFERRLYRAWCRLAGEPETGCRVLERSLLGLVLGCVDPDRIRIRIAAEISKLREPCDDRAALDRRLSALPAALDATCAGARLSRARRNSLLHEMTLHIGDVRTWLARRGVS